MARRVTKSGTNKKVFYGVLMGVAAVGVAALWIARSASRAAPVDVGPVPVGAAGDFHGYPMGNDSASVEIIEYADFECPACAQYTILTEPDVRARLLSTGRARLVFRDFPLPGHRASPVAHNAAACASEQGKFWPMHDQLYYNQGRWARDRRPDRVIGQIAKAIGLDMDQYDACMDQQRYSARIQAMRQTGLAIGVGSTPSFVVGGLLVEGAISVDSMTVLVRRAATKADSQ